MQYFCVILALISWSFIEGEGKLEHVQVLFRHGERMPDSYMQLPTDPLSERPVWSSEKGELTLAGKRQLYILGQRLRGKYGDLVDLNTQPSKLYVNSGNDNRTSGSALALLAGMFPPSSAANAISDTLYWQPVPIHTDDLMDKNSISFIDPEKCPVLAPELRASSDFIALNRTYSDLVQYLNDKSGLPVHDVRSATKIMDNLKMRVLQGKRIPGWASTGPMQDIDILNWGNLFTIEILKIPRAYEITVGATFGVIRSFMLDWKLHNLVLHSQHDTNIDQLMVAVDVQNFDRNVNPNFGGHIVFELHSIAGDGMDSMQPTYQVKALYSGSYNQSATPLIMGACPDPCSLEQFTDLVKPVTKEEWLLACKGDPELDDWRLTAFLLAGSTGVLLVLWLLTCCCCLCRGRKPKSTEAERRRLIEQQQRQPTYLN